MIFACVWAVGGLLCKDNGIDHKTAFSKNWKLEFSKGVVFPTTAGADIEYGVFDYYVDVDEYGTPSWALWLNQVTSYKHDPDLGVKNTHVETVETFRLHYMINHLVRGGHPVMLAGAAGLGKSVLLKSKL